MNKTWNFTFTDKKDGDWGWNSVQARTKASAIRKAKERLAGFSRDYVLDEGSLNTSEATYKMLMASFY